MLLMLLQPLVGGADVFQTWQDWIYDKVNLEREVTQHVKEQKQVVKKIAAAKKKLVSAKNPDGILANLHLLEQKKDLLTRQIKDLRLQIEWVNLEFEDEEDEELLLLQ